MSLRVRLKLYAALSDQLSDGRARACTALEPVGQALGLEFNARRLLPRIVDTDLFEPASIAGVPTVGDDDAVKGAFLATVTSKSNNCSHDLSLLLSWGAYNQPIPALPAKRATCFIIFFVC
jgi:hypothetical protein